VETSNRVFEIKAWNEENKDNSNLGIKQSEVFPLNEEHERVVNKVFEKIRTQHWYQFSRKNLFYSLLCWPKIRYFFMQIFLNEFRCWKKQTVLNKAYQDFETGNEKLEKEMDLVSMLDTMRKTNTLCQVLLNKHQKLLLEWQSIHSTSAQSEKFFDYPKQKIG